MITIRHLFEAIGRQPGSIQDFELTGAEIDSRKVIPGSLFFALPGERADGHTFISDAFSKGALLAIVQKDVSGQFPMVDLVNSVEPSIAAIPAPPFCIRVNDSLKALQATAAYWRRQLKLRVIGITGSVGKSSTKELVAEVLSRKYHTYKNPGNYNNEIGLPLTLLNMGEGHQYAVLEMGFYYSGEISFLCEIALPHMGIVTNIGTVHAERAGSQAEIIKGKTELVQALPALPDGIALLNNDDALVLPMAQKTKARVVTYGTKEGTDFRAFNILSKGLEGIEFDIDMPGGTAHVDSPLTGRHSVMTCLRAFAAASLEGVEVEEIKKGLSGAQSQLRMSVYRLAAGAIILDDAYNATPESTLAALELLVEVDGLHAAVLGDMLELGEYEHSGHEKVGERAAACAQVLIAIGPRSKTIVDAAIRYGMPAQKTFWFEDANQALDSIKEYCSKEWVLLVKGSHGMRLDRITTALKEME